MMKNDIFELQEIIDFQEKYIEILSKAGKFDEKSLNEERILTLISGLAISNSLYEMFIKKIIEIHLKNKKNITDIEEERKRLLKEKSISKLEFFLRKMKLDFENSFILFLKEIQEIFDFIRDKETLISQFIVCYTSRCEYIHGDFNLLKEITYKLYEKEVIKSMKLQNITLKIIKSSFSQKIKEWL